MNVGLVRVGVLEPLVAMGMRVPVDGLRSGQVLVVVMFVVNVRVLVSLLRVDVLVIVTCRGDYEDAGRREAERQPTPGRRALTQDRDGRREPHDRSGSEDARRHRGRHHGSRRSCRFR